MKFACLIYHNASKVADLSEAEQLAAILAECEAAGAWKAELEKGGHHVLSLGLQSVRTATTLRKSNGKLSMTDGPFAETKEFLGGFTIIETRDFNEALQLASKFASELVTVEVRPVLNGDAEPTDPLDQTIAAALRRRPCPRDAPMPKASDGGGIDAAQTIQGKNTMQKIVAVTPKDSTH
jgi:hypothetical protein